MATGITCNVWVTSPACSLSTEPHFGPSKMSLFGDGSMDHTWLNPHTEPSSLASIPSLAPNTFAVAAGRPNVRFFFDWICNDVVGQPTECLIEELTTTPCASSVCKRKRQPNSH